jgi:hypothetical protein
MWLGGCLLGLFGVELAQRVFFPGESPFEKWLGRSSHRESKTGSGSIFRTTPRNRFAVSIFAPEFHRLSRKMENQPGSVSEISIRRALSAAKGEPTRAMLACLLAEKVLSSGDTEEAHALTQEAMNRLTQSKSTRSAAFRLALERLLKFESMLYLREGQCQRVRDLLAEAESRFGRREWTVEIGAETYLLEGRTDLCRASLHGLLDQPKGQRRAAGCVLRASALLIEAESHLHDRNTQRLQRTLFKMDPRQFRTVEDKAAFVRLKSEGMLLMGDLPGAWRQIGILHRFAQSRPQDRGLKRTLHMACARLHLAEGNTKESHRRLQIAENECLYPIAHWEKDALLGMVLESEGRFQEAEKLWDRLSQEASGTHFGSLAKARASRFERRPYHPRYALPAYVS